MNIATKELFPIVVAAALWSPTWQGKQVLFRTDNQAVVAALALYSAHDPPLVHLLRSLFFIEAHFDFEHKVVHIPGEKNRIADALSRNNTSVFSSLLFISFCHPAVTIRTAVRPVSAVDISALERLAQFFARGLAARTVAIYGSAQRRYLTFCEAAGLSPLLLSEGSYVFLWFS